MTQPSPSIHAGELHSFVKLAIAYLGIMSGLAALGLVFYVAASKFSFVAPGYNTVVLFYMVLIAISLAGLARLVRRKRDGAYLAFTSLVISMLAPDPIQVFRAPYTFIWWFAIPNTVVGILLLTQLKTLE